MGNLIYGYRMVNGEIVVNEDEAERIRLLFDLVSQGESSYSAWRQSGLGKSHSVAIGILRNHSYMGESGYPQIVSSEQFGMVEELLDRRREYYSGIRAKPKEEPAPVTWDFILEDPQCSFEDPIRQAEYIYSLIRRK